MKKETKIMIKKGSMTVEAAVVIPLAVAFLAMFLFVFRILQIQTDIQTALAYASRKVATMASYTDSDNVLFGAAQLNWRRGLTDQDLINQYVKGGVSGVSLWESTTNGDNIELVASYKINFPFSLIPFQGFQISQRQVSKKWTGDNKDKKDAKDSYVYITSEGGVYHTSMDCVHLRVSVRPVEYSKIEGLRSRDDSKYYPCPRCAEKNTNEGEVYITDYGTLYHSKMNCSALKRSIQMVHRSEVGNRRACKDCGDDTSAGYK